MVYELACKDMGVECPYVAHGEKVDDVLADAGKHGKEVHGYTDEQLKDPAMQKNLRSLVKEA